MKNSITKEKTSNDNRCMHISESIEKSIFEKLRESEHAIKSGFPDLDEITLGWQKSDLIVIGARPKMGKTAFALSMMYNIAYSGTPVAFLSLKMSNKKIVDRLLSIQSNVAHSVVSQGNLNDYLLEEAEHLKTLPIFLMDNLHCDIEQLCETIRQSVKEKNIQCVFIDDSQMITGSECIGRPNSELAYIFKCLKRLAMELRIPIITMCQLNGRATKQEMQSYGRLRISDFPGEGIIEEIADVALKLYRPEYYKILNDENGISLRGIAYVTVLHGHYSLEREVRLRFIGEVMKFFKLLYDSSHNRIVMSAEEADSIASKQGLFERNSYTPF